VPVFLEDVAMNYFQDLRLNPQYAFDYTTGTVKDFKVHFKDVTGIETPETNNILCYLTNGVLYINFHENEFAHISGGATITVYNITGQQVLSLQTSQPVNEIPIRCTQSVYIVSIKTYNGNYTTKVFNH
jgi:hypothetical protein